MHIALIETSPRGQKGSMARYADLVVSALQSANGSAQTKVTRVNLAPPYSFLKMVPLSLRSWIHHLWIMLNASIKLSRMEADISHIVDGSQAYISHWTKKTKAIATAHDIIPLLQLKGFLDNSHLGKPSRRLINESINGLKQVKHVIAVSNNTAADLKRFANMNSSAVSVIPHAVPSEILSYGNSIEPLAWSERSESKGAYILHVGNSAFYKNREGVLRIFSQVRPACEVELKLVGSPPEQKERQLIHDLGIDKFVSVEVNPDDDELFDFYRKACLFLFPSLYEGFGWPPLEAMAFGCPVVCSNAASLPEVVGDAALTCSAVDETEMTENCLAVLKDASVANKLVERGYERIKMFSIERMGQQIMEVYRKVLDEGSR